MTRSRDVSPPSALAVLLIALVGACALMTVSVPAASVAAAEKRPLLVPSAFRLAGSNGYDLFVIGTPAFRKRPGGLQIYAYAKNKGVQYQVPATVTETSMQADLGDLGGISVEFKRSGRAVSVVCGDRELRFDSGSYEGTISFHGEEGFTTVEATTVRGNIEYVQALCDEGFFVEGGSGRPRGAELYIRNPALGQGMSVSKRRPGAAASIAAWMREYTAGGISIQRYTESRIPGSAFTYEGLAKLARPVAERVCRVGDFIGTSLSGWVYPKSSEGVSTVVAGSCSDPGGRGRPVRKSPVRGRADPGALPTQGPPERAFRFRSPARLCRKHRRRCPRPRRHFRA
jgi:hypothetical protein